MPTPYEKVFKLFLSKITDDLYLNYTPQQTLNDLTMILETAIFEFKQARVNVRDKNDNTQQFNQDLSIDEIHILANLMLIEWTARQLNSTIAIKPFLSDRDFNLKFKTSIDTLIKLDLHTRDKCREMLNHYHWHGADGSFNGRDL